MKNQIRITKEVFLYSIIFITAFVLRFVLLGRMPLVESEASLAYQAWQIWQGVSLPIGSQVSYLSITKVLFFLFGSGNFMARIWPALAGSLIVWFPYLLKQRLGRAPALLVAAGVALDPALVSISRITASPILAWVFLILAAGCFHEHKIRWALVFLFLALFSGPAVWLGIAVLGITFLLCGSLGVVNPKSYLQARFTDPWIPGKSAGLGVKSILLHLFIILWVGSFFFTNFQGLSAWMGSLPEFIGSWGSEVHLSPLGVLIRLVVSNPLILIFGGLGYLSAWRDNQQIGKISSIWFGVSFLALLLYPGRQSLDLIWLMVPLWIGAAQELVRIDRLVENCWVTFTLAGVIAVILCLNWLTFTGMVFQIGNQRAILLQWGLIAASLALVALAMTIVASEWDWPTAKKGLMYGTAGILVIYMFASMTQGAYLRAGDPRSLWSDGSGAGQINLLLDTIADVSVRESGRADSIQGGVLHGNSSLKWALRNLKDFEFLDSYYPDRSFPVLITPVEEFYLVPAEAYRGQDFVVSTRPGWSGPVPEDWISWIAFRSGPLENEDIILWVRNDLFAGD